MGEDRIMNGPQQGVVPENHYCPSEIVDIFSDFLSRAGLGSKVVYVTGIYLKTARQCYSGFYYDTLRDQNSDQELTLKMPQILRDEMEAGSLVRIGGTVYKNAGNKKLQDQLAEANKKNGEMTEAMRKQTQEHSEQMKALNASLESFKKDSAQQSKQHNETLQAIQKSNADLIGKNTALNEELSRTRSSLAETKARKQKVPAITYVLAVICVILIIISFAT